MQQLHRRVGIALLVTLLTSATRPWRLTLSNGTTLGFGTVDGRDGDVC